ncbi:hypothetical protein AbraIFM66950_006790 [Aspergillus brasiliensis]|nr:hypothetical protein AbraIFM66950_006790 [Aspergillus brasiliensis]
MYLCQLHPRFSLLTSLTMFSLLSGWEYRQPDTSQEKDWHLEALGMADPRDKAIIRGVLDRLAEQCPLMRDPGISGAKAVIQRFLQQNIASFLLFVRDSFMSDPNRAMGLLYQVYMKGRQTRQKMENQWAVL